MTLHGFRTTSGSLTPFRLGSHSDSSQRSGWTETRDDNDRFANSRVRRASMQSGYKGRETAHDKVHRPTTAPFPFVPNTSFTSSRHPPPSHESAARPSTADAMPTKKARGSILVAASDALGLKFGRKKPAIIRQPPPLPYIFPDVIEISAARRDEEDEERNRLREAAAHSIGLQVIPTEIHSLDESAEVDEGKEEQEQELPTTTADHEKQTDVLSPVIMSSKSSIHSVASPSPAHFRFRSRSLLVPSRTNSISISSIPPFPSTFTVIDQYQQSGTMLDKYYPTSSLRIFALSRNWRHKFMVLSSPNIFVTRNSGPSVSYLHLFKSSSGEEKEMERLEINEDSVVFISEEEVGGRKHVVKVGGVDVGAMKKERNCEENGRTMWFLHISDQAEAQKWITAIKTAILGQRTVRAGLGLPILGGIGVEPRGDMDVMLSMRAQGLITPLGTTKPTQNGSAASERNYASSVSSHHSQATVSRAGSTNAVSALRGFLSGSTRPRSGSRATSIESQHERDRDPQEDSFGSVGNHLLGLPITADTNLRPHSVMTHASLPISGSGWDRRIAIDRPIHRVSTVTSSVEPIPIKSDRANRTLSLGALSLQPPPRKRWTSAGPARPGESVDVADKTETEPSSSTAASRFTFGTPEDRSKTPSIRSVSTVASTENSVAVDKMSSSSTKRNSRRWSRQGMLPRRHSPPSGPPPSIPTNQGYVLRAGRLSVEIPTTRSETSSTHSGTTQKSFVYSLPSFSKRASGSSVLSASSSLQSSAVSRPTSSNRLSMPPQRPPPTSAPPPAPTQDANSPETTPTPPAKSPIRDTNVHRTFRLSLIAPKPPPTSVLPPRPDEIPSKSHRRTSTGSFPLKLTSLGVIPASPTSVSVAPSPPFPPPIDPLPPTPTVLQSTMPSRPARPQSLSFKERFRISSAPSPPTALSIKPREVDVLSGATPFFHALPAVNNTTVSSPVTQSHQGDPSFLYIHTPVVSHLPSPRILPEPHDIMPLPPPPRRGSKAIPAMGSDTKSPVAEEDKLSLDGERKLIPLSRPSSVVSLGFVNV